jgi:5,10-methylene-tetrahydrofolate dehydrogenase/methenyl tetrahydrofolate cyclohydrolase
LTAISLDSQAIADEFFDWFRQERALLPFKPRLATLLYRPTADLASVQYRDLILKDAARLGADVSSLEVSSPEELKEQIAKANADPDTHGIAVLYPLHCPVPDEDVMDLISPYKDAEGLHSINLGYLIKYKKFLDLERGIKCVVPATPKAVVNALKHYPAVRIDGAFVVIVNNSMRVGKPLGLMLENLGATVVKCYHLTRPEDLEYCVRRADILITAVPDPSFHINSAWVKPGAAVVDISYQGNVDVAALKSKASLVTVPDNRIGKVTRAMMYVNLIYCARYQGIFY